MASIKPLEGRTVHQIQSGQVIVDLCSVAKELVENSLDAGARAIDVRFKINGLEAIEVQDNGSGISSENYETIALKHYTSKLASYQDLSSIETFGFRGEALSSLCALSKFHIVTAREDEAPKGAKLDFETSGKLKSVSVVACQRGTTICVENLFANLPVRRRELEKNIKREYSKVLSILQAYACISTQARITVSNLSSKSKKAIAFSTRSNPSTRDNIANVFGAKSLAGLLDMTIDLEMASAEHVEDRRADSDKDLVRVLGHVSRPGFGEGRQAPDRQMFFVNSRPCNLPQVAKVFNEVYKSYNMAQSPFVFANILLNTNAYDVNVSPDKRTILLHDQGALLESLRSSLTRLFERQDQAVPESRYREQKIPFCKQKSAATGDSSATEEAADSSDDSKVSDDTAKDMPKLIEQLASRGTVPRGQHREPHAPLRSSSVRSDGAEKMWRRRSKEQTPEDPLPSIIHSGRDSPGLHRMREDSQMMNGSASEPIEGTAKLEKETEADVSSPEAEQLTLRTQEDGNAPRSSNIVQNAFDRMRPRRSSPEVATVTIGSKTTTSVLGSSVHSRSGRPAKAPRTQENSLLRPKDTIQPPGSSLRAFAAPGSDLRQTVGFPQSKVGKTLAFDHDSSPENSSIGSTENMSDEPGKEIAEESEQGDSDLFEDSSDAEFLDEDGKKAVEDAKVAEMIRQSEEAASLPSEDCKRRAQQVLKGSRAAHSTTELIQNVALSIGTISRQLQHRITLLQSGPETVDYCPRPSIADVEDRTGHTPISGERDLTISKNDFTKLRIVGQFNLGFVLVTRNNRDMFIVDQHASDEIINFERLQATTVIQDQQLVHPRRLELTAVDEEIILENQDALRSNGFVVDVDQSGDYQVGQRASLISLPMSKETTFKPSDLEELIALLADTPTPSSTIPRPTKIRKILAMRACRSSIMIGRVLTRQMMERLVAKMGEIDKPWNCPHGRPTMRHVCGLSGIGGHDEYSVQDENEDSSFVASWRRWTESLGDESSDSITNDEEMLEEESA